MHNVSNKNCPDAERIFLACYVEIILDLQENVKYMAKKTNWTFFP